MATTPLVRAEAARTATVAPLRLTAWRRPALRALSIGLFLLAWQVATQWDLDLYVRFQNIPSPGDVLAEAIELFGSRAFYVHILASLERIWLGFAIATALGVGLGLLIGWFALVEDILLPTIELLRPIPAVAWVPISIMLWPTERSSIVFITTLGAFFPIVLNTIHGVEGVDPRLVAAARSLGTGRWQMFVQVIVPAALPSIATGLAIGMGTCWFCLVSAEMISGQFGIGYYTWESYNLQRYPEIVVGMLFIGIFGMLSSAMVKRVGSLLTPWYRPEERA